jgi:lysophospholipase L1-like esterase
MGKTPFRILCFGASLTEGHPVGHPYAEALKAKLSVAFPSLDVQCDVDGVAGDLVTRGTFLERMARCWEEAGPYDWTVVLGGTK